MSFAVITISPFDRQAKKLSKKYPSFVDDLQNLINDLQENPRQGVDLGQNFYKIRLKISSKGKGKSGGARVITNAAVLENTVYLMSVYDKSEKEIISDKELKELLYFIE